MPDSLTALAILALVGVPGYVYLTLVGREPKKSPDGVTSLSLETVFFGLGCGVAAVLVSVITRWNKWLDLLVVKPIDGDRDAAAELMKGVLSLSAALYLQALLVAVFFAAIIRLLRAKDSKKRRQAIALLVFSVLMSAAVAIWI